MSKIDAPVWTVDTEEAHEIAALRRILADREQELLEVKGPCSSPGCVLHYAHVGPHRMDAMP